MKRVLIAVPLYETIQPETAKSIYDLRVPPGVETALEFAKGYDIATARNKIADICLQGGYDYVLFVDSDVVLPENALERLLSHEKEFVSGWYPVKMKPRQYAAFQQLSPNCGMCWTLEELYGKTELIEMFRGGFGCALVASVLFKRLSKPYFDWIQQPAPDNPNVVPCDFPYLSEDFYFCRNAHEAGVTLYLDPAVACAHMLRTRFDCDPMKTRTVP